MKTSLLLDRRSYKLHHHQTPNIAHRATRSRPPQSARCLCPSLRRTILIRCRAFKQLPSLDWTSLTSPLPLLHMLEKSTRLGGIGSVPQGGYSLSIILNAVLAFMRTPELASTNIKGLAHYDPFFSLPHISRLLRGHRSKSAHWVTEEGEKLVESTSGTVARQCFENHNTGHDDRFQNAKGICGSNQGRSSNGSCSTRSKGQRLYDHKRISVGTQVPFESTGEVRKASFVR